MDSLIDNGPPPACPANFNLAAYVLGKASKDPDAAALELLAEHGVTRYSHAQIAAMVRGCGTGLLALGLAPGARILMRLGNSVDFPVLFLGAIAAGFVPVPTSAQLTAPEVTRLCALIDPALIVAGEGVALPDDPRCPVLPAAALADMAQLPPCAFAVGAADRLAYIIFTSGTSGHQQAVAHAHRAILARGMMMRGWYGLTGADRLLHAGAFNWTYTLGTGLMDPWTMGATALIPQAGTPATALPGLLRDHRASIFAAAPGVYRQMLRADFPALPHLRHGLSAGEALPPVLREAWQARTGTDLHEAFGMSEVSTFISGSPAHPAPPGRSGFAQPGRRIAVLNGPYPAPLGTPGILAISRDDPGLFLGYFNDPEATAAKFAGEWYLTGDTAQMDADGAITYLGRADDMMNAGGYRVSPLEVEAAMAGVAGLTECAAVEHEVTPGTRIVALVYCAEAPLPTADLEAYASQSLARYKQPRLWRHIAALPRNANGKINRTSLRQIIATASPSPKK